MAEATVQSTRKTASRRSVASKAPAPKAAARKASAKRTAARKPAARKLSLNQVQESVKEVAYVQLGICGKVYDQLNSRVAKARQGAPKQWSELVKRGERVQRELDQARKDLRKDLKTRVAKLDVKADLEQRIEQVREAVTKIRAHVKKAA